MWLWVSWSKLNTSWTVLHFPPLRLLPIYFKNIPLPYSLKPKFGYSLQLHHHYYEFFGLPEWFLPFQRRQQKAHTTHKKGENKSWASAAAFARRLLLWVSYFYSNQNTFSNLPIKSPSTQVKWALRGNFFFDNFFFLSRTWVSSFAAILPHNQLEVADAFFGGKKDSDFGSK